MISTLRSCHTNTRQRGGSDLTMLKAVPVQWGTRHGDNSSALQEPR